MLLLICILVCLILAVFIGGFAPAATIMKRAAYIFGFGVFLLVVGVCVTVVEVLMGVHHVGLSDVLPWTVGIGFIICLRVYFGTKKLSPRKSPSPL